MLIRLPHLEKWQKDVYDAIEKRGKTDIFVVKARRQCGKSILANVIILSKALKAKCCSVVVEPTQAQSRRMFKQIVDWLEGSGAIKSANATLLTIEFVNGSEIIYKSAEQKDALRGFTVSSDGILVIDEGAFIADEIYSILYPLVDANKAPVLVISTPLFQSGEFYNLYARGKSSETVKSFDWSKYDTSIFLSAEKLEYYRQTVPALKFQSEYLGKFLNEGSYLFGSIKSVVYQPLKKTDKNPVWCGIDWGSGKEGDDTVVIMYNKDRQMVDIQYFNDLDSVEQIDKIAELINGYDTLKKVQVEINSIGQVFFDMLKRKVRKGLLQEFTTTNESKRRIIEQLITGFKTNDLWILDDAKLRREIQHYAVEKTSKGYTYNGADGVNDDCVIALALCYDLFVDKHKAGGRITFA